MKFGRQSFKKLNSVKFVGFVFPSLNKTGIIYIVCHNFHLCEIDLLLCKYWIEKKKSACVNEYTFYLCLLTDLKNKIGQEDFIQVLFFIHYKVDFIFCLIKNKNKSHPHFWKGSCFIKLGSNWFEKEMFFGKQCESKQK